MFEEVSKNYLSNNIGFVDSQEITCQILESYIAKVLFNSDLGRICYATPSIAFRKRMELTKAKSTDPITIQNLDLPFCNLYVEPQVTLDNRPAAVNASQILLGYKDETELRVRSMAIMYNATANFFFSNYKDLKIAQTLLYQECTPKSPVYIKTDVLYENIKVELPVNITYGDITVEAFDETNFLKQMRVYSLSVKMEVRTYNLFMPTNNEVLLPMKHTHLNQGLPKKPFITSKASVEWASDKLKSHNDILDVAEAYMEPAAINCDFYEDEINEESIKFKVKSEDFDKIDKIRVFLKEKWSVLELSDTVISEETEESFKYFTIEGLTPNSKYDIIFCVETLDVEAKLFKMVVSTKETTQELEPPKIIEDEVYSGVDEKEPKKYEESTSEYDDLEGLDLG